MEDIIIDQGIFKGEKLLDPPLPNKKYIKRVNGLTGLMKYCLLVKAYPQIYDKIKELISNNANEINSQTDNGCTALMIAVRHSGKHSTEETVKLLIESGANLDLHNNNGWTALMLAAESSNTDSTEETVRLLIKNTQIITKNMLTKIIKFNLKEDILYEFFDKYAYYKNHTIKIKLVNKKIKSQINIIKFKPNSIASQILSIQFDIACGKLDVDSIYNNLDKYNKNNKDNKDNKLTLKDFFDIRDKYDMINKFKEYIQ